MSTTTYPAVDKAVYDTAWEIMGKFVDKLDKFENYMLEGIKSSLPR